MCLLSLRRAGVGDVCPGGICPVSAAPKVVSCAIRAFSVRCSAPEQTVGAGIHIAAASCCGCTSHRAGTQMVGPHPNPAAGALQTSRPRPMFVHLHGYGGSSLHICRSAKATVNDRCRLQRMGNFDPYQPLGPVRHQGPLLMIFGPCFAPVHSLCEPRDLIFRSSSSRTTIPSRSDDLDAIVHGKRLTALDKRCRGAQSGGKPSSARNLCEMRNNSASDRFTPMRHLFITTGEPSCVPQAPVPCGRS